MRRNVLSCMLAVVFLLLAAGTFSIRLSAAEPDVQLVGSAVREEDYYYYNLSDGTVMLWTYCGEEENLELPSVFAGKTVSRINSGLLYSVTEPPVRKLVIPKTVTAILWDQIKLRTQNGTLAEIQVDPENPAFRSIDGVLFNQSGTKLLVYPEARTETSYTVPKKTRTIAREAFLMNRYLEKVILPEGLTRVGYQSFYGCSNLSSVNLPESLNEIAEDAFFRTGLHTVSVPGKDTVIGKNALGFSDETDGVPDLYLEDENLTIPSARVEDFVVSGYAGSAAENYAKENRLRFQYLESGKIKKWDYLPENAEIRNVTRSGDKMQVEMIPFFDSKEPAGFVVAVRTAEESYAFHILEPGEREIVIEGLRPQEVYYIRVRAYWKGKTKNYYSAWSKRRSLAATGENMGTAEQNSFPEVMTRFSVDFLKAEAAEKLTDDANLLVSPYSLLAALSMTANGMDGETVKEYEKVVGMPVEGGLNEVLSGWRQEMSTPVETAKRTLEPAEGTGEEPAEAAEPATFHEANSIWYRTSGDLAMKDQFLADAKKWYEAEVRPTDFGDAAVGEVNGWVKDKTDGMIEKLVDRFEGDLRVLLINAIAFNGKWEEPYQDYEVLEHQTFTNADGTEAEVTMLSDSGEEYITYHGAYGFTKNYAGGRFAFLALLPEEGTDLQNFIAEMDAEELQKAISDVHREADVYTKIPEFSFDYENSLVKSLEEMGLHKMFVPYEADFGRMADLTKLGGENLYVSDVLQKTHIELDREGTKAAAVTAIFVNKTTSIMPVERPVVRIELDRPFVFAIIDRTNNLPIFTGAVNKLP